MTLLWLGFLIAIVLGSLYPFTFDASRATPEAWQALWQSWGWRTSRGDIAGNVLLFVPAGFLGMMAHRRAPYMLRAAIVFSLALVVAAGVQIVQLYLPRSATMVDVTWNMVGLVPGLVFFMLPWQRVARRFDLQLSLEVVPLALIGCWVLYRLWPLLPTIDLQEVKNSLKPLLVTPRVTLAGIGINCGAWVGIAWLLRRTEAKGRLEPLLPVLIAVTFLGEIMIVGNTLSADNVLGAIAALLLWFVVLRNLPAALSTSVTALVFTGSIVLIALAPYTFGAPGSFSWLPFGGLLGGSMLANTFAVVHKTFLYGALAYIFSALLGSRLAAAIPAATLVFALEWAQIRLPGRTAEVTDPILVCLAVLSIMLIERSVPRLTLGLPAEIDRPSKAAIRETETRSQAPSITPPMASPVISRRVLTERPKARTDKPFSLADAEKRLAGRRFSDDSGSEG